jgi:hypothetical protein
MYEAGKKSYQAKRTKIGHSAKTDVGPPLANLYISRILARTKIIEVLAACPLGGRTSEARS